MDKKEFSLLAMAIKTYYPRENILPNQASLELWYRELSDIPYSVAEASLRKWVAANKWSPSICDFREMASELVQGEIRDWSDAWEEALTKISRYGSYRQIEALESMSELTRECVKRIGFHNLSHSENLASDRKQFRDIYENLSARKKKDNLIPDSVKIMIESTSTKMIGENNG